MQTITNSLPTDKDQLNGYREAQATDPECSSLLFNIVRYVGWPSHKPIGELGNYWQFRGEFLLSDKLLLYGTRIVVPASMRQVTLKKFFKVTKVYSNVGLE